MEHERCYSKIRRMCPLCKKVGSGIFIPSRTGPTTWICPHCNEKIEI